MKSSNVQRKEDYRDQAKTLSSVFIVDDHPVVRLGIRQLLNQQSDLRVCGEAEDASRALEQIEALKPDIVIVDIALKGMDGIELTKHIKAQYPGVKVLIVSMYPDTLYARRALRAGALGYVMKDEASENLVSAIRSIRDGEIHVGDAMAKRMIREYVTSKPKRFGPPEDALSDRELEIFRLIGRGFGTRQIAEVLQLSVKTIESHRARIKEKLQIRTAAELVQRAVEWVQRRKLIS